MRSALDATSVIAALIPSRPPTSEAERQAFVSEVARIDFGTGAAVTLLRLPAGTQPVNLTVAGGFVAWIEASATDLRAYGWRIHLLDAASGLDKVIASDPGLRVDADSSVIPALAFDGSSVAYTTLARDGEALVWQLRRWRGGRDEVLTQVSEPRTQHIVRLIVDGARVMWTETTLQPQLTTRLGTYDGGAVRRQELPIGTVYQLVVASGRLFLATDRGVMSTEPNAVALREEGSERSNIDQIVVVGAYLLYRTFDVAQSVRALELPTGAAALLGQNSTYGPVLASGVVIWFERAAASSPARVARTRV